MYISPSEYKSPKRKPLLFSEFYGIVSHLQIFKTKVK